MATVDPSRRQRQTSRWRWGFALAVGLCLVLYSIEGLWIADDASDRWRVAYGIAAALLLAGLALLGLRRRMPRLVSRYRLGSSRAWLRFHSYGGLLFLVLMLMHSGFHLPRGALAVWLWILGVWTVASGFAGLAIQRWIPRVLASGLSIEVLYERIPELIGEIRERAESLIEGCEGPLRDLYAGSVAPALAGPRSDLGYYLDITGGIRSRLEPFDHLRTFLPAGELERLTELERLFRTKLEIDAHYTLQQSLRWWIYAHLPPALALVALTAVHIFTVLYD